MRDDFAVFICTHGRPGKQLTLNTLKKCGYTGKWYLVLDDTDKAIQQYIDNYGAEHIIVFNKNYYINSDRYDNGDNQLHAKCVVYAKRAVEDIALAKKLSIFLLADDDVTKLTIRFPTDNCLSRLAISEIDNIFEMYCEYMLSGNLCTLGVGTPTNYFIGKEAFFEKNLCGTNRPLPYNFTFRNTAYKVDWLSWFAEDTITLYQSSNVGNVWIADLYLMFECLPIGDSSISGGMADIYRTNTDFELQFCAIKYCPQRLLLKDYYKNGKMLFKRNNVASFPKIISGRYKK